MGHPNLNPYDYDEMDFCIRAGMAGAKIYAFNNIRIRYYGGVKTSRFEPDEKDYLFIRHALRSVRQNYRGIKRIVIVGVFIMAAYLRTLMPLQDYLFVLSL